MKIPQEVSESFERFSSAANKTDGGTHPLDQNRFFEAVAEAFRHGTDMDFPDFDGMLKQQGWTNEGTRRRLFDAFETSYNMAKYLRDGKVN